MKRMHIITVILLCVIEFLIISQVNWKLQNEKYSTDALCKDAIHHITKETGYEFSSIVIYCLYSHGMSDAIIMLEDGCSSDQISAKMNGLLMTNPGWKKVDIPQEDVVKYIYKICPYARFEIVYDINGGSFDWVYCRGEGLKDGAFLFCFVDNETGKIAGYFSYD